MIRTMSVRIVLQEAADKQSHMCSRSASSISRRVLLVRLTNRGWLWSAAMTPASFCGITHEYPFMTPEPSAFGVFAAGQAPDHLPVDPLQAACQEQVSIAAAQRLCL
jgi:hypothetical protein